MSPLKTHDFNQLLAHVLNTDLGGEDRGVNQAGSPSLRRTPSRGRARESRQ